MTLTFRRAIILTLGLLIVFAIILFLMGREFLSDSGFGLWTGAWTTNTSQWMADPYSTSHILHGIIFFWLLLPLRKKLSVVWRFTIATLVEVGWEILENSPIIINRYREATASLEYFGDSIMNSLFDVLFMMFGFWLAWKYGFKWMIPLVVGIELTMLYFIRDNLTLNVLMLIFPIDAVREWQIAG